MEFARKRAASVLSWFICALSVALVGAGVVIDRLGGSTMQGYGLFFIGSIAMFSFLGALIAARRPENPIGWIYCVVGLVFGVAALASAWSAYTLVEEPGALPFGPFMSWLSVWTWSLAIWLLFTFLLLLFPDGLLPSRRWRPVAWLSVVALVAMVVPVAITAWPIRGLLLTQIGDNAPTASPDSFKVAFNLQVAGVLLTFALGLFSSASLIMRMRRATGDERQQIKWFAFAAALLIAAVILTSPLFGLPGVIQNFAIPLLPLVSAVAILKYRLYDIDVVITKTVIFTALAVFITAVYLGVVVGIGAAIGTTGKPNVVLSIVATAIVAAAFQPLRERARRLANRLVYGKRATPYEVLSEFSGRVGGAFAADDVLQRMAQVLAAGTGAEVAAVWLRVGGDLRPAAVWPAGAAARPGDFVEVSHQGETLGELSVRMPANDPMNPAKRKLVEDLASQAGPVLRNGRLIEELRASRQRLVAAQDEERRRIERNIHDGAQQQLVALAVKQRIAASVIGRDDERARVILEELQSETIQALEDLRDLARGVYPPLLADQGLAAALESQARKSAVPVDVQADGVGRFPQEIEAAVYFSCLEALQNVAKYAVASAAFIRLARVGDELTFEVADDGVGFDSSSTGYGTGLQGMADRLEALGGSIDVRSVQGSGTTIAGAVPVAAMSANP